MRMSAIALGLLLTAISLPADAQQGRWRLLGEREVNDSVDRDVITAPGSARYRQIRFCMARHAVRLYDITVRFANTTAQHVPVRLLIPAGACSRVIDLRYHDRNIATVSFTYEAASLGRERAHVRLFAR